MMDDAVIMYAALCIRESVLWLTSVKAQIGNEFGLFSFQWPAFVHSPLLCRTICQ